MEWIHEDSYKGYSPDKIIHKRRLKKTFDVISLIEAGEEGEYADFGCSNGYTISLLKESIFSEKKWKFYGFDSHDDFLNKGKLRNLNDVEFINFDLNIKNNDWKEKFDIVTCFETIEHVSDYKNALFNIYNACKKGGWIVISIPNEVGMPGIIKYLGRKREKNIYGKFFKDQSELKYFQHLVCNKPIHVFRDPDKNEYGPHLGFDWRIFEEYLHEEYVHTERCAIKSKIGSFFNFNFIYLINKLQ